MRPPSRPEEPAEFSRLLSPSYIDTYRSDSRRSAATATATAVTRREAETMNCGRARALYRGAFIRCALIFIIALLFIGCCAVASIPRASRPHPYPGKKKRDRWEIPPPPPVSSSPSNDTLYRILNSTRSRGTISENDQHAQTWRNRVENKRNCRFSGKGPRARDVAIRRHGRFKRERKSELRLRVYDRRIEGAAKGKRREEGRDRSQCLGEITGAA